MKKLFFILFLVPLAVYSQNTNKSIRLVQPYIETGIDFLRSEELKANYDTQSKLHYSVGFQLGTPKTSKIIPYIQYSFSKYSIEETINTELKCDSSLTVSQLSAGAIIPLKQINTLHLRSKLAYSFSPIKESFNGIDSHSHGFVLGIGIEKELTKRSRIYLDLSYNYQKTPKRDKFRDFDTISLSTGFVL